MVNRRQNEGENVEEIIVNVHQIFIKNFKFRSKKPQKQTTHTQRLNKSNSVNK